MDSLSAGAFREVINAGNDKQFVAMLLQMDEAFIGIHHLLQSMFFSTTNVKESLA